MAAFPSLRPSQRTISMGQAPIKEYRALNGTIVRRSFGNKRFGYVVELTFQNIAEASVSLIWDHYHDNQNLQNGFTIPDSILSGYSTNEAIGRPEGLISRVNRMGNITWFYIEPPSIESTGRSRSTVQVRLAGELSYAP
jgi:hypothetical protein